MYYLPGLEQVLEPGWPTFTEEMEYVGPLSRTSGKAVLRGRDGRGFRTKQAAAWPDDAAAPEEAPFAAAPELGTDRPELVAQGLPAVALKGAGLVPPHHVAPRPTRRLQKC